MRKSQATTEFLTTYGWAILAILGAVVALAYFGVLKPDMFLPEKCVIEATSGIYCEDFTADELNGITLRIKNVLKVPIAINKIEIETGIKDNSKAFCNTLNQLNISAESSANFIFSEGCMLEARDKIKGDIKIDYKHEGSLNRIAFGTLILRVASSSKSREQSESSEKQDICHNAQDGDLCNGLNLVFGENYKENCCINFGICC